MEKDKKEVTKEVDDKGVKEVEKQEVDKFKEMNDKLDKFIAYYNEDKKSKKLEAETVKEEEEDEWE